MDTSDLRLLTDEDILRVNRLQLADRRNELAASLLARRWLVADLTGCAVDAVRFSALESGAPQLTFPSGYSVTLANKQTTTVVALDEERTMIGVDAEILRPVSWKPILATICDDGERSAFLEGFEGADQALSAFFRMWTIKEAVLKTTGQGFRAGPKGVRVPLGMLRNETRGVVTAFHAAHDIWMAERQGVIVSLARRRT